MITVILILLLVASASSPAVAQGPVKLSTKVLGDRVVMQHRINVALGSYGESIKRIRDSLKATVASSSGDQHPILVESLAALDGIIQRQDTTDITDLLPLVDLHYVHNKEESPRLLGTLENGETRGMLNYVIDAVFRARLIGEGATISDHDLGAMVRFYAGNPAQTSETSWSKPNMMLFILGDRVVDYLRNYAPDKIAAFYKAVQDARADARSGPGPDETPIPASELPTAEQLSRYEAAFARLETLATQGQLPDATGSPASASSAPSKPLPKVAPSSPTSPAPKASASTLPAAAIEKPSSSTPWSVVAVLIVAAIGLLWLLLKNRK